jgi:Uma2 family endonuclease
MTASYEEIIDGEVLMRAAPGERHEAICARLHAVVTASLTGVTTARLLAPRSIVQLSPGTLLRPDLALVTAATGKLWLAAEIVQAGDHQPDTVLKKQVYEDLRAPRLWMIDPRYNNVEVYHGGEYGLALRHILAGRETLAEELLPRLQLAMNELFAA